MSFDFDTVPDRADTDSVKWAKYIDSPYPGGIIPLWVADMDFAAPPAVIAALRQRINHGVFGYNQPTASQIDAVVAYLGSKFDWPIDPDWMSGCRAWCRASMSPVVRPARRATRSLPRHRSIPPFFRRRSFPAGGWRARRWCAISAGWLWDFPTVDAVLKTSQAKLFLLCHPHNPTGRVWNEDELWQIALLAEKHDMVVCSDEIHNGLILLPSAATGYSPRSVPSLRRAASH